MLEPDVTLTDYLLSLLCAAFAWWCWRRRATAWRWYVAFFCTLSLASLLGGTVHGFLPSGWWSDVLWCGVLLSLGGTAVAMWGITTTLMCRDTIKRLAMAMVAAMAVAYATVVIGGVRGFAVSIAAYLPAAIGMLVAYVHHRHRPGYWGSGIAGVLLTFVAAGVQVGQVTLHPTWCNHNALYHLIQAIALSGIARAAGGRLPGDHRAAGQ